MAFDASKFLQEFDGDKLNALVETMYLAADADGEFSDDERDELAASIEQVAKGTDHESAFSGQRLTALLDAARADLERDGRPKRLAAVKARLSDDGERKGALGMAINVTAADGILRTSEREFILDLAEALDVDRDEAADLVRDITRP